MDTSLIINATNSGKKVTKAVTNINPAKDNTTLKTFAQMVNGLSTNSYVDATRINKQSVEEADAGGGSTGELTFTVTTNGNVGTVSQYVNYETIEGGVRLWFSVGTTAFKKDWYIDVTAQ